MVTQKQNLLIENTKRLNIAEVNATDCTVTLQQECI